MVVALGVLLAWRCLQRIVGRLAAGGRRGALRRQCHAALFDPAEARGMVTGDGVAVVLNEIDLPTPSLVWRSRIAAAAARRALDTALGVMPRPGIAC